MNTDEIAQRIVNSHYYKRGTPLRHFHFTEIFRKKLEPWRLTLARRQLIAEGKLVRVSPGMWQKPADSAGLLRQSWRKHSNEELGVRFDGRSF
jgi:hypothetical protein